MLSDTLLVHYYYLQVITGIVFINSPFLCYSTPDHIHTVVVQPKVPTLQFLASRFIYNWLQKNKCYQDFESRNEGLVSGLNYDDTGEEAEFLPETQGDEGGEDDIFTPITGTTDRILNMFWKCPDLPSSDDEQPSNRQTLSPELLDKLSQVRYMEPMPRILPQNTPSLFREDEVIRQCDIQVYYLCNEVEEMHMSIPEVF